jgi:DNA-binding CsgD family transcriptional regulator
MTNEKQLDHLIEILYETALDPARWTEALGLMPENSKSITTLDLPGKLYNLSAAELRVASALLAGDSPEDYAMAAGVKMNTVRTRIKTLFYKTDTKKQLELVALLSKLPPLL